MEQPCSIITSREICLEYFCNSFTAAGVHGVIKDLAVLSEAWWNEIRQYRYFFVCLFCMKHSNVTTLHWIECRASSNAQQMPFFQNQDVRLGLFLLKGKNLSNYCNFKGAELITSWLRNQTFFQRSLFSLRWWEWNLWLLKSKRFVCRKYQLLTMYLSGRKSVIF